VHAVCFAEITDIVAKRGVLRFGDHRMSGKGSMTDIEIKFARPVKTAMAN
jgi:hypothetical protein